MQPNLLDQALERHLQDHTAVSITLRDRSKVNGMVKDFDAHVILLSGETNAVVYRHSVLKLEVEAALPAEAEKKPEPRPRRSFEQRPPEHRKPGPRRDARPPRPSAPEPRQPSEKETEAFNPMSDVLAKWLQSQQGGG
jgi:sRNA-binding regulator protein Hfq